MRLNFFFPSAGKLVARSLACASTQEHTDRRQVNIVHVKMMLRQWSRRSASSALGPLRRLQQHSSGGGRAVAAISTIANNNSSSWIYHRSLNNDADAHIFRVPASRAFSSVAEEYHPEPRPFKKIMAGKQILQR